MDESSVFQERGPETAAEWEFYYDLRWRVLRGPWGQPRGSERDDRDSDGIHAVLWRAEVPLAGGRLHFNSATETQIRYMAVDPDWQGKGLGSRILAILESRAAEAGSECVVLNARGEAASFYRRHGYREVGSAGLLFGSIPHIKMQKVLPSP